MEDDLVLSRIDGRVATLILNRPDKRNALSPELLQSLAFKLTSLTENPEVRCVVLRGAGTMAFSAGFDIGRIGQDAPQPGGNNPEASDPYKRPKEAIAQFPYPVIAMIYGFCVGGGLEIAAACDLRIAADNARLGITPAKLGIVYNYDPIRVFVNLIGPAFTKELFLSGRLVEAKRAREMGLVNEVVPAEDLESFTYEMANEIAENAPLSVRSSKLIVNRITSAAPVTSKDQAHFKLLRDAAAASEDLAEGKRAFLQKRKPVFRGT